MSLYCYQKEGGVARRPVAYVSYVAIAAGASLLFWAFYPVVTFQIYSVLFIQRALISPLPDQGNSSVKHSYSKEYTPAVFSANVGDFTQAARWFPQAKPASDIKNEPIQKKAAAVTEYVLSIPKLNIEKARVVVGGQDLAKGLVHYLPTSLPGQRGNVAIFGHSTLPQLYNSRDYKSIFTYLHQLERGDKIRVQVGAKNYQYEVSEMFVVKPDAIDAIEPKYDGSYLTLVTCVPPGSYWNRLVLRAHLVQPLSNL